ncbi:MAG: alpha/beta fold hydrolase [Myxococcaceae bacterium]
MPIAHVNGQPLHYLDEGTGTPIVLIHAFPFDSGMYRPQIEGLKGRFRIIAPDLRGFGKTAGGKNTTMDSHATDVAALLDVLGIDHAIVGGVSMGGYVSLALLRVAANKVSGLVLIDTQATPDDAAGKAKREENASKIEKEGIDFWVDANLPKLVAKDARAEVRDGVKAMIRSQTREGVAGGLRAMALRPDSRDMLARFGGKAVVIVGEHDEVTPLAKAQQMAELVAGTRVVVIPGVGHLANWESPAEVNRAIAEFVGR